MKKKILILSILTLIFCINFLGVSKCGLEAKADELSVSNYLEFVSAITAASDGDVITLASEIEITSKIDINKSLSFVPSNGRCRLIYTGVEQVAISNDEQLTQRHFNILGDVSVTFVKCDFISNSGFGGVYSDSDGAVINFDYCTFTGLENTYGGAVCVESDHSFVQLGFTWCTFKGNQASRGGAVYIENAKAYFEDCNFQDNIASSDGSAICVNNYKATADALINIVDSNFDRNLTKSIDSHKAGVISLNETSTEIVEGTNYSKSLGFALVQNCKFVNNIALKSGFDNPQGVAFYLSNFACDIDGCTFTTNTNQGDAILAVEYLTAKMSFNLKDSFVQQNYVYGNACALLVRSDVDGYFKIYNCVFMDNISKDGKNIAYGAYTETGKVDIDAIIDEYTIVKDNYSPIPYSYLNPEKKDYTVVWVSIIAVIIAISGIIISIIISKKKDGEVKDNNTNEDNPNLKVVKDDAVANVEQEPKEVCDNTNINQVIDDYGLSKREADVLQLLLEGKKRGEIAESLYITTETVKSHTQNIYKKLGVSNKVELVIKLKEDK